MSTEIVPVRPSRRLPRLVYAAVAGTMAALVGVGWLAYGAGTYSTLAFSVAALVAAMFGAFIAMVVSGEKPGRMRQPRLEEWLRGRFETGDAHIPAREAMIQVMLPVATPALGFVAIAFVAAFVL